MIQTPSRTHEAQYVKRRERHEEPDDPTPESVDAEFLLEPETEYLREPIRDAGKIAEDNSANYHVVEMRNQK